MLEKDMFISVKKHLETLGFDVKAEVLNTDITAIKEETVIVVELKTTLNIKLLYQGCMGQKLADYVYLAIPKQSSKITHSKSFKEKVHLVKRLGLGLLFVDVENQTVDAFLDPIELKVRTNKRKKTKLLKEFQNRVTTINVGGVTRTKIMTSYKERAIRIAYHLIEKPLSIKEIKVLTKDTLCGDVLRKNYYNWFEKVERGIYSLSELGREELSTFHEVIPSIMKD